MTQESTTSRVFFRILAGIVAVSFSWGFFLVLSQALKSHQPIPRILIMIFFFALGPAVYAIRGNVGHVKTSSQDMDGEISSKRFWISILSIIGFIGFVFLLLFFKK